MVSFQFSYSQDTKIDSLIKEINAYKSDDSIKVKMLVKLAKNYISIDLNKNLTTIEEALALAEKIKYTKGEGVCLNALSQHYIVKGDLDEGLTHALKAKSILSAINDNENLLVTNSNLARIYNVTSKYDKSIAIHLQNIEIVKDNPPSPDKAGFYFYVAKTYEQLHDYKNAETYYLQAKNISNKANFNTGVSIAQGSLGNLYSRMGEFNKAIRYLTETLKYSIENNQTSNIAAGYYSLALSHGGLGNYDLAIDYNQKAISIYEDQNNLRLLKEAYLNHSKFYEKINQFESSIKFLKMHYAATDSLFSQEKVKVIEELQTKYETEKKEVEIASLSQKATIQALEIQQKNQAIVIGLVVLLFGSVIIYFIYRQRSLKKQQSQIELEQRFLRSQLNPHFIFNALSAIQNFMLKNNAQSAGLYLIKFSKLMREILENSRKEFISVDSEIEMLTNYLDIHKLRLNNSFDYKIELDDNIDPDVDTIPPMFVQPFVENAIEHGIINASQDGLIKLNFTKQGEYILIHIIDNGQGISSSRSTSSHNSLATTIIKERMALFNQSLKYRIQLILEDIKNDQGEIQGTKVELKVPFSYI